MQPVHNVAAYKDGKAPTKTPNYLKMSKLLFAYTRQAGNPQVVYNHAKREWQPWGSHAPTVIGVEHLNPTEAQRAEAKTVETCSDHIAHTMHTLTHNA